MVPPIQNPCDFGNPEPCGVNPAFTYTRYPCDFDDPRPAQDTRGLPVIVDLQTPVRAEVVNRQRESVLAIEAELGIQPSGTFTTVRARLDALEGLLCSIWTTINDTGSPVDVKLNGTTIVAGVRSINFFGTGINVTDAGGFQADVQITGGGDNIFLCTIDGYAPAQEALPVLVNGQTNFTLTAPPYNDLLLLFIEGIKQELGDYTVNGTSLTWSGTPLLTTDTVEVFYTIEGAGDGYDPVHEALPVLVNGQTSFTLTDNAWDNLVVLFVGGIKQDFSDYSVNGNQLIWSGTALVTTDVVEALYYKVIPGGASCGGGGGGGSPLSISDEGVLEETNVTLIDFVGPSVSAVGDGSGGVTVTITSTSTIMHQEVFTAIALQTVFNLANTPISQQATELFIDGVSQTVGTDYTLSGSSVIYSGSPALTGGEEVVIKYFENLSVSSGIIGLPEVLSVNNITDGYDIDFDNSSTAINLTDPINPQDAATKAYVDGYFSTINISLFDVLDVGNITDGYDIDFDNSSTAINLTDPINPQDAATKAYVDGYFALWGLPEVLSVNNLTGSLNVDFQNSSTAINLLDPVNPQDAATKVYVDGYFALWGLPEVLSVNNLTGGFDIDFNNNTRGINCLDPLNPQDVATKAYVDGYVGGSGYLGVDVFVESASNLPAAIAGIITLAPNTVYGIDGLIDLGTDRIAMSVGSKLVGGGGSSTTSELRTSNALAVVTMAAANTSIEGLTLQNTSTGSALTLASGASDFSIVDVTFTTAGSVAITVTGPGLGQIMDSFVNVSSGGDGILVNDNTTSFLVKSTKFSGVGAGSGNGINMDSASGTRVVTQMAVENCRFEDLGNAFRQNNDITINGNLSIVGCSAININTFIRREVGATTQSSIISNNSIWNVGLFTVGLAPGGNQMFRGNISQGIAQTESPII